MLRESLPLLLILGLITACDKPTRILSASETKQPVAPSAAASAGVGSAWLGRWTGPEGTYLEVLAEGQMLKVAIRSLDGVRTFEAISANDGITFERDGTIETIKFGAGSETGMKWLQDKSSCLIVKAGEGYCRR